MNTINEHPPNGIKESPLNGKIERHFGNIKNGFSHPTKLFAPIEKNLPRRNILGISNSINNRQRRMIELPPERLEGTPKIQL